MMERTVRYELIPDEDDVPAEPMAIESQGVESECVTVEVVETPAEGEQVALPLSSVVGDNNDNMQNKTTELKIPEPPSYSIATTLPTYEEAEQTKQSEEEERQQRAAEEAKNSTTSGQKTDDVYLGTDGIFICSFLVAFLFNCLGLFAVLCISQTIAARFGAVSGFGLSIVKYVAVMKYQNWVLSWNDGFSWLWWFMLFLGLLMFLRGVMQYIRIKHQWSRLSQQMRGRIYLYF